MDSYLIDRTMVRERAAADRGIAPALRHQPPPADDRRLRRLFQRDRLAGATSAIRWMHALSTLLFLTAEHFESCPRRHGGMSSPRKGFYDRQTPLSWIC